MNIYPNDADGEVLAELAAHGIDMTEPLLIEYAVLAPDEPAAAAICAALEAQGYEAWVEFDEGELAEHAPPTAEDEEAFGPAWTVYAHVTMVPEYHAIICMQQRLDEIAAPFHGKSDGWGAMLNE